jgi:hypothetical protein
MGLDMYAYRANEALVGDSQVDLNDLLFEDGKAKSGVDTDFQYWRKFNALHGWMENLYYAKGGKEEIFNCATVRVTLEDLDKLEQEIDTLKPVAGFFFGSMDPLSEEDKEDVRTFIDEARSAIDSGHAVIYSSWW